MNRTTPINTADTRKRPGFLVTAVPRSGTTLFARVMNGHPDLICGSERFHGHSFSPDHLTEEGFRARDLERVAAAAGFEQLEQKAGHPDLMFGEKFPRAYMYMDDVLPRFEAAEKPLKIIVLLRDTEEVANSWYRRAVNPKDKSWPSGMRGVFPYFEQIILAWQLSLIKAPQDVLLVSYASLLNSATQGAVLGQITDHLGLSDAQPFMAVMDAEAGKSRKSLERDRSDDPVDFQSDDPMFTQIAALPGDAGARSLADVQKDLRRLVEQFQTNDALQNDLISHLEQEEDPEIRAYHGAVKNMYFSTLKRLDRDFATRVDSALKPPRAHDAKQRSSVADSVTYNFDISDAVYFLSRQGSVTGIQRVQIDAMLAFTEQGKAGAHRAVYLDSDRGWISIPVLRFTEIFKESTNLQEDFSNLTKELGTIEPIVFGSKDVIFFLGATWAQPYLTTALRDLHENDVRIVMYLHDVLPLQVPEYFPPTHGPMFSHWLKHCITFADGILCNSNETKSALLEHARFDGQVEVADLNITPTFISRFLAFPQTEQIKPLEALDLVDVDYVLAVGTLEPRKNHQTLLNSWITLRRLLGETCPKLVIVGKVGWKSAGVQEALDDLAVDGSVISLRDADDHALAALYQQALMTVSLSRKEGWNLPITESLSMGVPCVAGLGSGAVAAKQGLTISVDELSERETTSTLLALLRDRQALQQSRRAIARKAEFKSWKDFNGELLTFANALFSKPRHSVPKIELGARYKFDKLQNPRLTDNAMTGLQFLTGTGWNAPDEWGCWSRLHQVEISFDVPTPGNYVAYGVVTPTNRHSNLPLSASVGKNYEWHGTLHPERRSLFVLPFAKPETSGPVRVQFRSAPPYDFSRDESTPELRTLGFALIELRLISHDNVSQRLEAVEEMLSACR